MVAAPGAEQVGGGLGGAAGRGGGGGGEFVDQGQVGRREGPAVRD